MPRARAYHAGRAITLDTNLLSVSGASAWAIDEYLKAKTSLPPLGIAFVAAEKRYGVNARFLLAAAMHESAWGTGYIARKKHNLFGHNAYDRNPLRFATAFATYAASIDSTARFIKEAYLTPRGRWWGGRPTLRSMQQFWSSSHRWGIGVSQIATSIHLHSLARRSIRFAAPAVDGPLNGQSQASVRLDVDRRRHPGGGRLRRHLENDRARFGGRRRAPRASHSGRTRAPRCRDDPAWLRQPIAGGASVERQETNRTDDASPRAGSEPRHARSRSPCRRRVSPGGTGSTSTCSIRAVVRCLLPTRSTSRASRSRCGAIEP